MDSKPTNIYKLSSPRTDKIYISHSIEDNLKSILKKLKYKYAKFITRHSEIYREYYEILQYGDSKIELLASETCKSYKDQIELKRIWLIKEGLLSVIKIDDAQVSNYLCGEVEEGKLTFYL